MNADYFISSNVFYVFGAVMVAGVAVIAASHAILDRIKRSRNTVD